jgi:hypothetical protein
MACVTAPVPITSSVPTKLPSTKKSMVPVGELSTPGPAFADSEAEIATLSLYWPRASRTVTSVVAGSMLIAAGP